MGLTEAGRGLILELRTKRSSIGWPRLKLGFFFLSRCDISLSGQVSSRPGNGLSDRNNVKVFKGPGP